VSAVVVVRASAPAKAMLFGEYAVLSGWPALALCLDRRITCEAMTRRGGGLAGRLRIESAGVFEPPIEMPMEALAESAQPPDSRLALLWPILVAHGRSAAAAGPGAGLQLRFSSGFPSAWGLGSSSASTLAAAAALRVLSAGPSVPGILPPSGQGPGLDGLFEDVRQAQRSAQGGLASGYDVATQILGGIVRFRDEDAGAASGPGAPESARIEPRPGSPRIPLLVAWTGRKAATSALLPRVLAAQPLGSPAWALPGRLADVAAAAIREANWEALAGLFALGHAAMRKLGVVPAEVDAAIGQLSSDPAVLGARLSGAGGGDCVLLLARDLPGAAAAVQRAGLQVLDLKVESDGLLVEAEASA
jgi:mevalonate kinase